MSDARSTFEDHIVNFNVDLAIEVMNGHADIDPNQKLRSPEGEEKTPLQYLIDHLPEYEVESKLTSWCQLANVGINLRELRSSLKKYSNWGSDVGVEITVNKRRHPRRAIIIAEHLKRRTAASELVTAAQLIEELDLAITDRLWLVIALKSGLAKLTPGEVNGSHALKVLKQCADILDANNADIINSAEDLYGPETVPADSAFSLLEEGYFLACTYFNSNGCRACYQDAMKSFRHNVRDRLLAKFGVDLTVKKTLSQRIADIPSWQLPNFTTMLRHMVQSPLFATARTWEYQFVGKSSSSNVHLAGLLKEARKQLAERVSLARPMGECVGSASSDVTHEMTNQDPHRRASAASYSSI